MTVTQSAYDRRQNELYETEAWATRCAAKVVPVTGNRFWECCAGNHLIVDVLRQLGAAEVITSDIAVYSRAHDIWNFFDTPELPPDWNIFTNPPYGDRNILAVKFARHALKICSGYVVLLLTAKFDFGKKRVDLFRDNPRFMAKIALYDRIRLIPGTTGDGTEDHAWYIWAPRDMPVATPQMYWDGR